MAVAVFVDAFSVDRQSLAEAIAYLDTYERDLVGMAQRIREHRYHLFSILQSAGLDDEAKDMLD